MAGFMTKIGVVTTTYVLYGGFVLYVLTNYLKDVWGLSFTHAAGVTNVFWGCCFMLAFATQFVADAVLGNYWVISLALFAYTAGLGLLAMSTPPALARLTGTCTKYRPECVGKVQKILFYIALLPIAIGVSSSIAPLMLNFIKEQKKKSFSSELSSDEEDENQPKEKLFRLLFFLVPVAGFIAAAFISHWLVRFAISAICTALALILLLTGSCSYERNGPKGSLITTVFRVFIASISKMFRKIGSSDLYKKEDYNRGRSLEHTSYLRCLDKAALVLPEQSIEQQSWRLCTVTEVEKVKLFLRVIPISLTLIVPGLVSSIGNTYFMEQADNMNNKLGCISFTTLILPLIAELMKSPLEKCSKSFPRFGVGISIIFATLSCIVAAIVETRRLRIVAKNGKMSMFWLLPQFLLLGFSDAISTSGFCEGLLRDGFPKSMSEYMLLFAKFILGAGASCGVLSVYVVGEISGRGGKTSWFQSSLNKSRLDNYYWVLAAISAANLLFYLPIAIWYKPGED